MPVSRRVLAVVCQSFRLMKTLIAFLAALAMTVAACGGNDDPGEPTTTTEAESTTTEAEEESTTTETEEESTTTDSSEEDESTTTEADESTTTEEPADEGEAEDE